MSSIRPGARAIRLGALFLVCALTGSRPALSLTMVELSLEDLVLCADAVVSGEVLSATPAVDPRAEAVETTFEIRAETSLLAGVRSGDVVSVRQLGGRAGDLETEVPGSPRFAPGERVFVFLEARGDGAWRVLGMSQGKYEIRTGPSGGGVVTRPDIAREAQLVANPAGRIRAPDAMPLDAFVAEVSRIAAVRLADPGARCGVPGRPR